MIHLLSNQNYLNISCILHLQRTSSLFLDDPQLDRNHFFDRCSIILCCLLLRKMHQFLCESICWNTVRFRTMVVIFWRYKKSNLFYRVQLDEETRTNHQITDDEFCRHLVSHLLIFFSISLFQHALHGLSLFNHHQLKALLHPLLPNLANAWNLIPDPSYRWVTNSFLSTTAHLPTSCDLCPLVTLITMPVATVPM